jgi:zinc transport system ATP-binding protein
LSDIIVKCENLTIGYGGLTIISGFNLEIFRGDYLIITGENGSGKTTLICGLLGLLPIRKGSIKFENGFGKSNIGYLPQSPPTARDFPASVMEVVLSGTLTRGHFYPFYRKTDKKAAIKSLDNLGILSLKDKCFRELSLGQKKKVLLSRALLSGNGMLVLDEPVSGLDSESTEEFYNIIASLNKEQGTTIIMVTHDNKTAKSYANRELVIGMKSTIFSDNYIEKKEVINV